MTANSTARLGLMAPVDSDLFLSADFTSTFNKLDAVPGTTIVANYAALTALTWGIPQHGSKAIQADNLAEWLWYNPSGTGVWKRTNTIGVLNTTVQSAPIATILQSGGPTFITSGNFTVPGGRTVHVHLNMGLDNTTGVGGIVGINILDNAVGVDSAFFRAGSPSNAHGYNCHFHVYLAGLTANSTHNITANLFSTPFSAGVGGQGTSTARISKLVVSEV